MDTCENCGTLEYQHLAAVRSPLRGCGAECAFSTKRTKHSEAHGCRSVAASGTTELTASIALSRGVRLESRTESLVATNVLDDASVAGCGPACPAAPRAAFNSRTRAGGRCLSVDSVLESDYRRRLCLSLTADPANPTPNRKMLLGSGVGLATMYSTPESPSPEPSLPPFRIMSPVDCHPLDG